MCVCDVICVWMHLHSIPFRVEATCVLNLKKVFDDQINVRVCPYMACPYMV